MATIGDTEAMGAEFTGRLSAEIDRVFARLSVARGMGVLPDAKSRLMAMVGPDPADFEKVLHAYASLALTTGAEGNARVPSDPGLLGVLETRVALKADDAAAKVAPWTGDSATAFDTFIGHFKTGGDAVGTQRLAIDYLHLAAEAHQRVYINSRQDLWNLVTSLDAGIDSSEDISSPGIGVFLTVVAAIATGGAGALAAGIGATTVGLTAIAAAGSSGAAVISGHANDKREIDLDPHDKWTLRDSLLDLIGTMETDLLAAEEQIHAHVQALAAAMGPMSELGRKLVGPSVTPGASPIVWAPDGSGSLPKSYTDGFVPPSETD